METLLAVGLLAGILTASFSFMSDSLKTSIKHQQYTRALQLANEKMESIIADNFLLGYSYVTDRANYPTEDIEGFTRSVDWMDVQPNNLSNELVNSGLTRISVKVYWKQDNSILTKLDTLVTQGR